MALKISHERADMRRQLSVRAPIGVQVDGSTESIAEWSSAGIVLERADYVAGREVDLRLTLPFQGFDIGFPAKGVVEAKDASDRRSWISFVDLGKREQDLLSHFIDQLVRGNMTSVDDTILRLDAPMAASAMGAQPTLGNVATAKQHLRPVRTAMATVAYGLLGAAAIGYLASLAYTNYFWLEAQTSTISAPVENLVALGDGTVSWATFKPGDIVKAGDVLVRLADNTLEREIEQAEIAVREKENKLAFLVRRFESEKVRLGTLAGLSNLKSARTTAEIEGLKASLAVAQKELQKLPSTAAGALALLRQRIVTLKQQLTVKELEVNGRASLARDASGSREIVGQSVVGDVDTVAAQIELAESDIAIAMRRHQSYLNQRERLALKAPFDGILRQLPHSDNGTVRKGDVAAVVERTAERGVTAYLRQDQIARIQLGAEAVVHVPATRTTFRARVAEIDPARAVKSEAGRHAGHGLHGQTRAEDGLAAVRLALTGPPTAIDLGIYRDGLPAVTMIGLGRVPRTAASAVSGTSLAAREPDAASKPALVQVSAASPPGSPEVTGQGGGWYVLIAERWIKASRPDAGNGR